MLTHLPLGVSGSIHLLAVFPIPLFITAVKVMDLLNADGLQNAASNVFSPQLSWRAKLKLSYNNNPLPPTCI